MIFDSVQIGAPDVESAARELGVVLGRDGRERRRGHRFALERGAVEIVRGVPGILSLRFRPEPGEVASWPAGREAYDGLEVLVDGEVETAPAAAAADIPHAIDHVVIQSPNLERAIRLWRDRLGVRLALDREFPQRGLRLLFFRSGGVTLEFSGALGAVSGDGPDTPWGIAYQVMDLAGCRERLLARGVDLSAVRPGQKKGTLVATLESHDLGVPTLLIQPVQTGATTG